MMLRITIFILLSASRALATGGPQNDDPQKKNCAIPKQLSMVTKTLSDKYSLDKCIDELQQRCMSKCNPFAMYKDLPDYNQSTCADFKHDLDLLKKRCKENPMPTKAECSKLCEILIKENLCKCKSLTKEEVANIVGIIASNVAFQPLALLSIAYFKTNYYDLGPGLRGLLRLVASLGASANGICMMHRYFGHPETQLNKKMDSCGAKLKKSAQSVKGYVKTALQRLCTAQPQRVVYDHSKPYASYRQSDSDDNSDKEADDQADNHNEAASDHSDKSDNEADNEAESDESWRGRCIAAVDSDYYEKIKENPELTLEEYYAQKELESTADNLSAAQPELVTRDLSHEKSAAEKND